MTHLGSWLSALADGQLTAEEAERALAHVATCSQCATELAADRAAHRALSAAAAERVEPTPGLTARLLSLAPAGAVGCPWRPDPFQPVTPLPGGSPGLAGHRPGAWGGELRGDPLGGGRRTARDLAGQAADLAAAVRAALRRAAGD